MTTRSNAAYGTNFVDANYVDKNIKNLASAIGLSYERTDTPDEILLAIEDELQAQIDEAEENPQELSALMGYYRQLHTLDKILDEIEETKEFFKINKAPTPKHSFEL